MTIVDGFLYVVLSLIYRRPVGRDGFEGPPRSPSGAKTNGQRAAVRADARECCPSCGRTSGPGAIPPE